MELNIEIAEERWGEVTNAGRIALEDYQQGKEASRRGLLDLLAPFLKDEKGNWMNHDDAIDLMMPITENQMIDVVNQFNDAVLAIAVPKENGNSSSSQSTTEAKPLGG